MIFTFPFLHYFIFLCDLLLQDIGFICLRIYLSNAIQMTVIMVAAMGCRLFLLHFSVSILHHQNENVNKGTKFIFTNKILKQTIKE